MAERRVLRWTVPLDDEWHDIGPGPVALVAWRLTSVNAVEVWTIEDLPPGWPHAGPEPRKVRVFGTGHLLAEDAGEHVGSTMSHGDELVWHVFAQVTP